MINQDKRKAVYLLHEEGMGECDIARSLHINRGTVRKIIKQRGIMPSIERKDKIDINTDLLIRFYKDCNGMIQRVHEKLLEDEGISIGYSTLTRKIGELDLIRSKNKRDKRCSKVPDKPGDEMQHDTSPYKVRFGEKQILVQASLLYFRYSKIRYLKFYPAFNRFKMKCFFHEALTFWGYGANVCIIDNTNLARLRGTGKNAVIVPEMEQFSRQYGFEFICHEVMHSNRKAGIERGFYTVVTNFFTGRKFESLEDLNHQAFLWSTVRSANKPTGKTHLVPISAFEFEKPYLNKLPSYIEPPYLKHERHTDQYGHASFDGNFYWVPGTKRYTVKVLQYADHIKIYYKRELLGHYELPAYGVKNKQISPEGGPKPEYKPKHRQKSTTEEEKKLRTLAADIDTYLTFILKKKSAKSKHRFIREMYGLYKKLSHDLLLKTVKRALKYRITDMKVIENIAFLLMKEYNYNIPGADIDYEFKNREAYREGQFSGDVDLSFYDKIMEEDDE
ncbi:MAG: helix-turn-helix domain-containing protein [archaeon]|nr:helix-turn-helix domain-containing protein [archaeon]